MSAFRQHYKDDAKLKQGGDNSYMLGFASQPNLRQYKKCRGGVYPLPFKAKNSDSGTLPKFFFRSFLVFFFAACIGITSATHAFVLPAEQILGFMIKSLGQPRRLLVNQSVVLYPDALVQYNEKKVEKSPIILEGTLSFRFPERFCEEISSAQGKRIFVVSPAGVVKIAQNQILAEAEDQYDLYKDLLLYRNPDLLMSRLALCGVDTDVTSLGRWQGKIMYVIGAQYPDETAPQVWIDKEDFLPVRFIITRSVPGATSEGLEIRYQDWQGLLTKKDKNPRHRYPGVIVFLQNGKVISERVMDKFAINPSFSANLFDVVGLKATCEPSPFLMEERVLDLDMEDVKKAVRDFSRVID